MSERDAKKNRILEAAMEIFSAKDYHEATVEEIAKKAGVGKGTIYQYFPSKQAILENLCEYRHDEYLAGVKKLLNYDAGMEKILAEMVSFHIDNVNEVKLLIKNLLFSKELAELQPPDKNLIFRIDELVGMIWQKGIEKGELKDIDRQIFSSYLVGVMFSVGAHMVMNPYGEMNLEEVKREFTKLALNGIMK